jgi:nucleolar protein 56
MKLGYVVRTPTSVHLFDSDMQPIAEKSGSEELTLDTCSKALNDLKSKLLGLEKIVVEEDGIRSIIAEMGLQVALEQPSAAGKYVRSNLDRVKGQTPEVRLNTYRSIAIEQTQLKIVQMSSSLDQELIRLVYAHDTLAASTNEVMEKLVDLVSLYFPELRRFARSPEKLASLLEKHPSKEDMLSTGEGEISSEVMEWARRSRGAATPAGTAPVVREYATTVLAMTSLREEISQRISKIMGIIAPNTSAVAGPLLGAKLMAKAGGLVKLAKLASSSVQVMGAEKALFRAMREGGRPPKHGFIFQNPMVHNAPRKLRGKVARALASKITIACRIDTFSGAESGEELTEALRKKVEALSAKGGSEA